MNSDLCRLATSSCLNRARVLDGQRRLGGEGPEQLDGLGREVAGRVPGHGQAADQTALAEHGYRQQSPDAGLDQGLAQPALVRARHGDVGHLRRLERHGRPSDHALAFADLRGTPSFGERARIGLPGRHTLREFLGRFVVFEDDASVQPRELDGARDDGREHGLQIERGADGLAHLAEGGELPDGAGEVGGARLQLA